MEIAVEGVAGLEKGDVLIYITGVEPMTKPGRTKQTRSANISAAAIPREVEQQPGPSQDPGNQKPLEEDNLAVHEELLRRDRLRARTIEVSHALCKSVDRTQSRRGR